MSFSESGNLVADLRAYASAFQGYTELRVQENRHTVIRLVNGSVVTNEQTRHGGVSARVYQRGAWGFAAQPQVNAATVRHVIAAATAQASFLDAARHWQKGALPQTKAFEQHDWSAKKKRASQTDLIQFLKFVDAYAVKYYARLQTRAFELVCRTTEKSLFTADASAAYTLLPQTALLVRLCLSRNGQLFVFDETYGGFGPFEEHFLHPESFLEQLDQQYEHLLRKAEGRYPDAGLAECVVDSEIAGVLAQIAANAVAGGAFARPELNQQIGSSLVTLVDFAHTAQGQQCPAPVFVDDEGTKAQDVALIEQGVFKHLPHNKESARDAAAVPTGHACAADFAEAPQIQMRNTAFLPGQHSLAEMIGSIQHGYYLMQAGSVEAAASGDFLVSATLGYEITHGRLGRAIQDTSIAGTVAALLASITMVSKTFAWRRNRPGGDLAGGMGGAAIKCRLMVSGR